MKKLYTLLLFTTISYSQTATINFYYGTEKMLGGEVMFLVRNTESTYLGGGFSGALTQNRRVRPIEADEKWCSLYAVGSLGYYREVLGKVKAGLAVYTGKHNFNEVLYKPLVGISLAKAIKDDVCIEVGYDTFNNCTIGFTILFK